MEDENRCRTCLCMVKNIPAELTDNIYEFLAKDLGIKSVPKHHPELQLPQIVCSSCNSLIMEFQRFLTKCREAEKYFTSKLELLLNLNNKDMECNDQKEFFCVYSIEDVTNRMEPDNNLPKNINAVDSFFDPSIVIKEEPQLQEIPTPDDMNTLDLGDNLLNNINDAESILKISSVDYDNIKKETELEENPKPNPKSKKKIRSKDCSICGKRLQSFAHLRDHENVHKGIKPYCCDICGKCFTKKNTLINHQKLHVGKKIECEMCGKKFTRSSELILHDRVHRDEKPFQCDFKDCNAAFRLRPRLLEHQAIHTGEKKFKCDICGNAFFSASNLCIHKNRVHATFIYQCDLCVSWFPKPISMRRHMDSEHQIQLKDLKHLRKPRNLAVHFGKPLECEECGKKYSRNSQLMAHIQTHRLEKPFVCDFENCKAEFRRSAQLKDHKTKHTGIRNFRCDICENTFFNKTSLRNHMYKVHPKVSFKCNVCPLRFSSPNSFQKHMSWKHSIQIDDVQHFRKSKNKRTKKNINSSPAGEEADSP